jgi:hypothetical protein
MDLNSVCDLFYVPTFVRLGPTHIKMSLVGRFLVFQLCTTDCSVVRQIGQMKFAAYMAVCCLCGCLLRMWLFAAYVAVCCLCGCLLLMWLFAAYVVVCCLYGCLLLMWLFAAYMAVCCLCGCLLLMWLFAAYVAVCCLCGCLLLMWLFRLSQFFIFWFCFV